MVQPAAPANIEAEIHGEISGQVIVGNHNVQIHAEHGALVNVIPDNKIPAPRPRPTPVLSLRPRRIHGLLDRQTEATSAVSACLSNIPVEVYGEAGIGKTSLVRYLAYHPDAGRFADGVVYASALHQPVADLFQFLFDAFYECEVPLKPTDTQVRQFLQGKQALVLLDDVEMARDEIEGLMNAVPGCAFIVASTERRLWADVQTIALHGLPQDDGLALVEQELGRPLTSEERDAARTLCTALDGHPLRILQQAASVREDRRSLLAAAQLAHPAPHDELTGLTESERSVLGALGAFRGATVHAEHIAALGELADAESVLLSLERRNLVQVEESRYRLSGNLVNVLEQAWDLTPWRERGLAYFTTWAEQQRQSTGRLLEEADVIQQILDWAGASARWREVQRLGRAVEGALTLGGRWEAWRRALQWVLQASRALKDAAGEAWALHQLGTRALCLTDTSTANTYLSQALGIRESLGDRMGAAVSRHNLNILPGPLPAPDGDSGSSLSTGAGSNVLPLLLKVGLPALLLGIAGLWAWQMMTVARIVRPAALLAASASSSEISLSWVDNSDNEAEFKIERKKGDGVFTQVASVGANSTGFKDTGLEANTNYVYRIRAATADGNSEYSNESRGLTLPAAPSDLSLRAVSPTPPELRWMDKSPNPSAFKIERSIDGGATFSGVATVPAGTTNYSDTAIVASVTHYYRVLATNASGDSGYSNTVDWTLSPKPPAAPRLVAATAVSSTQVKLQWADASSNESGFKIERRSVTGSYFEIAKADPNATAYEDRDLKPDTTYTYRIRATNDAGDSPYSNEFRVTTPLDLPAPPSDLTVTLDSSFDARLIWKDNSDNEAGFHIERVSSKDSRSSRKELAPNSATFTDSGLAPGTTYTYSVQAFNRTGNSASSNKVSITTPVQPGTIAVSPLAVRFGSVTVGTPKASELKITNIGKGVLNGDVGKVSSPFGMGSEQQTFSLSNKESLTVTLNFVPPTPGDFTAALVINSNDPSRPQVQVTLSGTARPAQPAVELVSLSLDPPGVTGGKSSTGTVQLSGKAPDGGVPIQLSSKDPSAKVRESSVTVGAGKSNATFHIDTSKVGKDTSATISASTSLVTKTAVLELAAEKVVEPPAVSLESLTLNPQKVEGGQPSKGTVRLNGTAPNDIEVRLSTGRGSSGLVTIPKTVTVKAGSSTATFQIGTTKVVKDTSATISASFGSVTKPAVLQLEIVEPPPPAVGLESLSLNPEEVKGGQPSEGTVSLNGTAPNDIEVRLSIGRNSPRVATVPETVTVKAGNKEAKFRVTTYSKPRPANVVRVANAQAQTRQPVKVEITASLGDANRTKWLKVLVDLPPGRRDGAIGAAHLAEARIVPRRQRALGFVVENINWRLFGFSVRMR